MLRSAQRAWRTASQRLGRSGALRRSLSDAAGGGKKPHATNPLEQLENLESETASRIFENVRLPEEMAAASAAHGAGAAAGAAAAEAAAMADAPAGPMGRAVAALGNALFFGGVATSAFFGYYTWRYDADQVSTMVDETRKPENAFVGSSIWLPVMEWYVGKRRELEGELKKYADPPSDRMLPDLPPHARHIKTLVLDLDNVLVHSDWTRGRGWRTFKRPGVEDFIQDMSQYYELVVYTSQLPTYADPILDRLDPQRLIQYRLYRDSTQYVNGHHVRDLSKLNRDMRQVLLITADPAAYSLQPENAIKLKKWETSDGANTTLLDLLPFLEAVVKTQVPDVREVVCSYEGEDIPTAFRERMKRVAEQRQKTTPRGFFGGRGKQ